MEIVALTEDQVLVRAREASRALASDYVTTVPEGTSAEPSSTCIAFTIFLTKADNFWVKLFNPSVVTSRRQSPELAQFNRQK